MLSVCVSVSPNTRSLSLSVSGKGNRRPSEQILLYRIQICRASSSSLGVLGLFLSVGLAVKAVVEVNQLWKECFSAC